MEIKLIDFGYSQPTDRFSSPVPLFDASRPYVPLAVYLARPTFSPHSLQYMDVRFGPGQDVASLAYTAVGMVLALVGVQTPELGLASTADHLFEGFEEKHAEKNAMLTKLMCVSKRILDKYHKQDEAASERSEQLHPMSTNSYGIEDDSGAAMARDASSGSAMSGNGDGPTSPISDPSNMPVVAAAAFYSALHPGIDMSEALVKACDGFGEETCNTELQKEVLKAYLTPCRSSSERQDEK